eukprot:m.2958 g.2958  ORF g.2958 m.2958 type:complete len:290 (+) comp4238_c0_seq2:154-1023(+)
MPGSMSRPLPYGAVISAAITTLEREYNCKGVSVKEITSWMEEYAHFFATTLATDHWKLAARRCLKQSACFFASDDGSWQVNHDKLTISAKAVVRKLQQYWQRHPQADMEDAVTAAFSQAGQDDDNISVLSSATDSSTNSTSSSPLSSSLSPVKTGSAPFPAFMQGTFTPMPQRLPMSANQALRNPYFGSFQQQYHQLAMNRNALLHAAMPQARVPHMPPAQHVPRLSAQPSLVPVVVHSPMPSPPRAPLRKRTITREQKQQLEHIIQVLSAEIQRRLQNNDSETDDSLA